MTTSVSSGWMLSVDFGTSNTAAAHVDDLTGAVQTLPLSYGANLMSSSVYVQSPTRIEAGEVAQNKAAADPSGYLATPNGHCRWARTSSMSVTGICPRTLWSPRYCAK